MKKTIDNKKLDLNTQTVRLLTPAQLTAVAGGELSPSPRPSSAGGSCR